MDSQATCGQDWPCNGRILRETFVREVWSDSRCPTQTAILRVVELLSTPLAIPQIPTRQRLHHPLTIRSRSRVADSPQG